MSPKKPIKVTAEACPHHHLDHSRSGYGDAHATTNYALLVEHAVHLGTAGLIDKIMVAELTKPIGKMHYTGENADIIPSMQLAMKHQKDRDAAQEKLL
ncbi:hypothetical protein TUN205_04239 [Pyrenophora tritici-repentis]|nr:hypothetical protein TUN205_04239 [Pyrenophora tritici-repentis]PWO20195.1 FabG, Dehydrogenase [Pyrenophora tritici-repentis]